MISENSPLISSEVGGHHPMGATLEASEARSSVDARPVQTVPSHLRAYIAARSICRRGSLPSALIIGAQKAGTSSLFSWLSRHPHVANPLVKEVHYFDYQFARSTRWYAANFRGAARDTRIDASPYYLFHPKAAERAAKVIPDTKIICLFRDPVDRAYSHYKMNVRLGIEDLPFDDALDAEAYRLGRSAELLAEELVQYDFNHQHFSYVARGHYSEQLRVWLNLFQKDQFHFIDFARLVTEPQATLSGVLRFLNLPEAQFGDLRPHNVGTSGNIPARTRSRLEAVFSTTKAELYDLTNVKV
jgi:hypothetical protein